MKGSNAHHFQRHAGCAHSLLVDGKPVLRTVKGRVAEGVINTRALIVKIGGRVYLHAIAYGYEAVEIQQTI